MGIRRKNTCYLKIIKWNVIYGSGDYEDQPDIRDDIDVECYYLLFESIFEKGRYESQAGGFLSVKEAKSHAEKVTCQKINWSN
jgi:hypothetical protein